jgi:hypothetical protein
LAEGAEYSPLFKKLQQDEREKLFRFLSFVTLLVTDKRRLPCRGDRQRRREGAREDDTTPARR